jgi:hypothetical protein
MMVLVRREGAAALDSLITFIRRRAGSKMAVNFQVRQFWHAILHCVTLHMKKAGPSFETLETTHSDVWRESGIACHFVFNKT